MSPQWDDGAARGRLLILVFRVGSERHAVAADAVIEVARAVHLTPLPGAPTVIPGVVDRRGVTVPVVDTRRRFGHDTRGMSLTDHLVFVRAAERTLALWVDQAEELVPMPPGGLETAQAFVTHAGTLAGVCRLEGGLVLVHDLAAFLAQAEAERLDAAMAAREGA